MTVAFEADRFRSTAAYYTRYRVPYPDSLIQKVAIETGFRAGERLLDLGCGPGQLGIAFARLAGAAVIGMDPEPEMLEAAREAARQEGVAAEFRQGSSYDLGPGLGPLALTVMGRSFHWMDRAQTLQSLDSLTRNGGAVVLFGDRHISCAPDWRGLLNELSTRFSPERAAERDKRRSADWAPHEAFLLESPFNDLLRIGVVEKRHLTADDIVGRAFSMSVTSVQALGGRAKAFEAALRSELAALSSGGDYCEYVETFGLIARRS